MPKRANTQTSDVCSECPGRCCTGRRFMFGHLALEPGEADKRVFKDHIKWCREDGTKEQRAIIDLSKGCPFLGKDNRCTIYSQRPKICREFICYYSKDAMSKIDKYPTHKRLLNRWKCLPGQEYGLRLDFLGRPINELQTPQK